MRFLVQATAHMIDRKTLRFHDVLQRMPARCVGPIDKTDQGWVRTQMQYRTKDRKIGLSSFANRTDQGRTFETT